MHQLIFYEQKKVVTWAEYKLVIKQAIISQLVGIPTAMSVYLICHQCVILLLYFSI